MSEMVERVARAICKAKGQNPDDPRWIRYPGPTYEGIAWHAHEDSARAAIAAMREPIEAMINSAHDRIAGEGEIADVWCAMIDEALRE